MVSRGQRRSPIGRWLRSVRLLALAAIGAATGNRAPAELMPGASPELIESGVPAFVVLSPESLGLSAPPTDLHELPNGAILLVAQDELAVGDGVRWETFRRAPETDPVEMQNVAVDHDGTIYAGVPGGFARIDLLPNASWRLTRVADAAPDPSPNNQVLSRVITVGDEWYWHGGTGALVAWRPGRTARRLGTLNDPGSVFVAAGQTFASDASTGEIFRVTGAGLERVDRTNNPTFADGITSGVTLPDGSALLASDGKGLQGFDGHSLRPLASRGLLASHNRVTDVCRVSAGHYAAAVDNLGIVFFDLHGHITQVLDRTANDRLSRIRRVVYIPGRGVWALLNQGLAIVEFPSRVADFAAQVSTGLRFSQIDRHEGRLWLTSDGLAQRGIYDGDGRLLRFEADSPDPLVSMLLTAAGPLLVGTNAGIYRRTSTGWALVVPAVVNPQFPRSPALDGRWLYAAVDEVGLLRITPDRVEVERFPAPGMGEVFVGIEDGAGAFWCELGAHRIARVVIRDHRPVVRVFDRQDGLGDGWVQAFVVDGIARFNVRKEVLRYDEPTDRFVPDTNFLGNTPGLISADGRPARDARGRLWVATRDGVRVLDDRGTQGAESLEHLPAGLSPALFTPEDGGVMWMHQRQRLVRFDPALPETEQAPLRAVISRVQFLSSNRNLYSVGRELPALDYRDNSLAVRFLSLGGAFSNSVTFDVLLEGAGATWVPTGTTGSASFTNLREGHYLLRIRPRSGAATGIETTLAFTINPPWFRTSLAYALYAAGLAGAILVVAGGWMLLARREQARLVHLVAERTLELRQSEERYRNLSTELEQRVRTRTAEVDQANARLLETNRELEAFSYSVSHDLRAPLRNISGFTDLLRRRIAAGLDAESNRFLGIVSTEATRLSQLIDSLLAFSRLSRTELKRERIDTDQLLDAVRRELALEWPDRTIDWQVAPLPPISGDPTLLRQVFLNLLDNAIKFSGDRTPAIIAVGTQELPSRPGELVFFVRDNGVGFNPQYGDKLFGVFQRLHAVKDFEGTGIGLANVRRIVARHGGSVWAESAVGQGATFFLSLPAVVPEQKPR